MLAFSFNQANTISPENLKYNKVDNITIINRFKTRDIPWIINFLQNNKNNLKEITLQNQNNLLHLSVNYKIYKAIKFLLSYGFDIALQNDEGNTPLHIAIAKQDIRSIDLLMKSNSFSKALNIKNHLGLSPLDLAKKSKNDLIKKAFKKEDFSRIKLFEEKKHNKSISYGNNRIYLGN